MVACLYTCQCHMAFSVDLNLPPPPAAGVFSPSYICFFKPPPSLGNGKLFGFGLGFGYELQRKGKLRRQLKFVISAELSKSFSLNFGLDSQSLNSFQSHDPSQLPWVGPVPGDIAEVEAYCRIFRTSERLHSALMDALCNPLTGECRVSYEVPSDEKPQLEDKIVSVLGCMVSLVNKAREDVLSRGPSIMNSFRVAEVSTMDDELPPLAIFRSEMKRCSESLHVALENYLIPGDDRSLNVWRKLQRLKNVCYDSGFPREEDYPCHMLFANWSPVYLSSSKEETESKDSEAVFWTGGQVTEEGLKWLLDKEYKTIIDLRAENVKDNFCQAAMHDAIASGRIELVKIPVEVRIAPTMEQVVKFASYASDCSRRPIYLHSKEGVWRTSAMVSRWRQYMTRSASHIVASQVVNSNNMLSRYTNGSGKLQESSMTAKRSSPENDTDSLQESLDATCSSVETFDRSTSPKKDNKKTQSNEALSGFISDARTLSESTAAANGVGCFSSSLRKTNPLKAQVPPCNVFSKKEMSSFLGSRKISPSSYFNYQIKRLEFLPDSRNMYIQRLEGGMLVSSGDNPVSRIGGPGSSNGSAHVDYPSGEPKITAGSNWTVVNGRASTSVGTTVNGFSKGELYPMTNTNVSTAVTKTEHKTCSSLLVFANMGTQICVGFAVLFLLMSEIAQLCLCGDSNIGCIEGERQALLKFKASFNHPSHPLLSTWEGNDCCQWKGIGCNNITGHVISLNLSNPCSISEYMIYSFSPYFDVISPFKECYGSFILEAQNVDPSLLQLKHLSYLDLSRNDFNASPVPMFLGSMTQLTYLSLSYAGFSGRIPHSLGNLTSLRHLDLGSNFMYDCLYADEISWISQLSSLKHLDISWVDLGKAHNLFQVLNLLPSLLQIRLSDCELANSSFPHPPINLTNLTRIEVLDLSWNALQAPFLDAFQNMTSVSVLDLSYNNLDSLPFWLDKFNDLVELHFWGNRLDGQFPSALQNLTSIKILDLSWNNLSSVPSWLVNFKNLIYLDLSLCQFDSPIPNVLRSMTSLKFLDLSWNNLFFVIPSWLGELKSLVQLNLGWNELKAIEGSLSSILRNMCCLKELDFSNNKLQGEAFGEYEFSQCTKYNLQQLNLGYNEFNDSLPTWLGQLENLRYLDLQSNLFFGSIPLSLGKLSSVRYLPLSHNHLNGTIPQSWTVCEFNLFRLF